jgi:YD repeat-containing protein
MDQPMPRTHHYRADDSIASTTDPTGATTKYTYTSRGEIESTTRPGGATSTSAYDLARAELRLNGWSFNYHSVFQFTIEGSLAVTRALELDLKKKEVIVDVACASGALYCLVAGRQHSIVHVNLDQEQFSRTDLPSSELVATDLMPLGTGVLLLEQREWGGYSNFIGFLSSTNRYETSGPDLMELRQVFESCPGWDYIVKSSLNGLLVGDQWIYRVETGRVLELLSPLPSPANLIVAGTQHGEAVYLTQSVVSEDDESYCTVRIDLNSGSAELPSEDPRPNVVRDPSIVRFHTEAGRLVQINVSDFRRLSRGVGITKIRPCL